MPSSQRRAEVMQLQEHIALDLSTFALCTAVSSAECLILDACTFGWELCLQDARLLLHIALLIADLQVPQVHKFLQEL